MREPPKELRASVVPKILRRVVRFAGAVEGPGRKAGGVQSQPPRTSFFSRAAPAMRLEFARRGALAVAVERPEGGSVEEGVPVLGV
eukprot:2130477-Pleurochrysis_carterae.AAC.1